MTDSTLPDSTLQEFPDDLTGLIFGRLTVIGRAPSVGDGARYQCLCSCGTKTIKRGHHLRVGAIKSCGCLKSKHGYSPYRNSHRLYRIWRGMKTRCLNPNFPGYKHWGGRGISICKEWIKDFVPFRDWALANGYADDLSIDRIDNDGNYEPENCRWTDNLTQAQNKQKLRLITFQGQTKTMTAWARSLGLSYSTLRYRLNNWPVEEALTKPVFRGYLDEGEK